MIGARPLTLADLELLEMCFVADRERLFFRLCLTTGMRPAEALRLRVKDCFSVDRILLLRRNTKGKVKSRSFHVPATLKALIGAYVASQGLEADKYLFQSRESKGGPVSYAQMLRSFKAAVSRAGLKGKVTLHSPRKTFARHVYDSVDKDLVKTAKALGHTEISNTVRYLSFDTHELDQIVDAAPWAR